MFILILILPFLGFLFSGLFGRFFGRNLSPIFSSLTIFLTFIISIFAFYEVSLSKSILSIKLFNWLVYESTTITFGLLFDSLTCIMLIIVSGISFLVHLYSIGYMSHDPHISRFMSYLSLFTFFMLVMVTSDNYVQMFIGWEGVGLCSYLLINFWYTRVLANKAALKAMIMNRIADVFFSLGIILILITFKTTDYLIVFNLIDYIKDDFIIFFNFKINKITLICFFLFIGGVGKSAQLGLHTWLPDAMEGPTPVSSLLHAATMVTAGVFLIIRSSPLFEFTDIILVFIIIIGGLTAFFSAIIGVFQYDIKKIIAYSTCSQLGYMFFSCGLSNYQVAIFHLFNHAFFKALLFLSAGSVIHAMFDEQDMRKFGGLVNFLPFTYLCILVGSLAIMGFPFLTGFYSKDLVLELTYSRYVIDCSFIYFLGVGAAFFTAVYSIRLILFVFFFKSNSFRRFFDLHESSGFMLISMFILLLFSIFIGYLFSDICVGWGTFLWNNSIFLLPSHFNHIDSDFLHPLIKNLPIIFSIFGFFIGILFINFFFYRSFYLSIFPLNFFFLIWNKISSFFYFAGFFNSIYNDIFLWIFQLSYITSNKYIDKGWLEFLGPFGLYKFFRKFYFFFKLNPPSIIFFNIGFMFFSFVFFLVFLFLHSKLFIFLILNKGLILISFFMLISNMFI